MFILQCLSGIDEFYDVPIPIKTKGPKKQKWTRGKIRYRGRIILVINFYIIVDDPYNPDDIDRIRKNSKNTELCFEIEKTLSRKTE